MRIIMHAGLFVAVIMAATTGASLAEQASKPQVLRDGDGAKVVRFENMHQTRFIELFFGTKDPETGKLVAPCYNTMYSSNKLPESKDTSPQALVEGLDLEKLAKEHGVAKVMLNGPKLWMPDWVELKMGKERDFGGMTMGWVAQLNLPESGEIEGATWGPMQIARTASGPGPRAPRSRYWTMLTATPGY